MHDISTSLRCFQRITAPEEPGFELGNIRRLPATCVIVRCKSRSLSNSASRAPTPECVESVLTSTPTPTPAIFGVVVSTPTPTPTPSTRVGVGVDL